MSADKLPRIGTTIFFRHKFLGSVATLTWMRLGGRAGLGWQLSTPDLVIEDVPEDLARGLARFLVGGNNLNFDDQMFSYGWEHNFRSMYSSGHVHWLSNCTAQFWVVVRTILQKSGYLEVPISERYSGSKCSVCESSTCLDTSHNHGG